MKRRFHYNEDKVCSIRTSKGDLLNVVLFFLFLEILFSISYDFSLIYLNECTLFTDIIINFIKVGLMITLLVVA